MDWYTFFLLAFMWIGGGFYLLQKISLPCKEIARLNGSDRWYRFFNIRGWQAYLVGLVPIFVYFGMQDRWIAAFLELGGGPAMWIGLKLAKHNDPAAKIPPVYDRIAIAGIVVGIGLSSYRLGTLTSVPQFWEFVMVAGFLIGTYQLGKDRISGYLWFFLMFLGCGVLSHVDDKPVMVWQQIISAAITVPALALKYYQVRYAKAK